MLNQESVTAWARRICRYAAVLGIALVGESQLIAGGELTNQATPAKERSGTLGGEQPPTPSRVAPAPSPPVRQAESPQIPFKRVADIDLNIQPSGKLLPDDVAAAYFGQATWNGDEYTRNWAIREFAWEAPGLCYRPLYFEEVGLERHGHSFGVAQPAVSSAQFFGRSLALPCLMAVQPPGECIFPLGHDRPGDSVPHYIYGPLRHR